MVTVAVMVGNKRSWTILAGILAPLPGWIIPRIIGTIAFLAAPTWIGLILIVSWRTVVPGLMVLAWWLKRRYNPKQQKVLSLIEQRG